MKINKTILFLILLTIVIFPLQVIAAPTTIAEIINNVVTGLQGIGAGLATIAFIVAGIMFLTAVGNPSRMAIGKGALIAAVTGIVIILLASVACNFINGLFGLGGQCGGGLFKK